VYNDPVSQTMKNREAIEIAKLFVDVCTSRGWQIEVRNSVVSISKRLSPGDNGAYVDCDMDAFYILNKLPLRGGSIWGTTSDSIGGYSGLTRGEYVLNKSGNTPKKLFEAIRLLQS